MDGQDEIILLIILILSKFIKYTLPLENPTQMLYRQLRLRTKIC